MIASNPIFVIAAYSITWIVLLGYLVRLLREEARARAGNAPATREAGR